MSFPDTDNMFAGLDSLLAETILDAEGTSIFEDQDDMFSYGDGNFLVQNGRRWFQPIGPAPEGWKTRNGCSHTIPHTDESEQWMNDEQNADHYAQ